MHPYGSADLATLSQWSWELQSGTIKGIVICALLPQTFIFVPSALFAWTSLGTFQNNAKFHQVWLHLWAYAVLAVKANCGDSLFSVISKARERLHLPAEAWGSLIYKQVSSNETNEFTTLSKQFWKSNHSLCFLYIYLHDQTLYCKIQYTWITKLLQIGASILHIWCILHFIGELKYKGFFAEMVQSYQRLYIHLTYLGILVIFRNLSYILNSISCE